MNKAGILAIASLVAVGGLTQSAPRLCPLPLRELPRAPAPARAVNADRPASVVRGTTRVLDGMPDKPVRPTGERVVRP